MEKLETICDEQNRIHERVRLNSGIIVSRIKINKMGKNFENVIDEFRLDAKPISREEYFDLIKEGS